MISHLYHSRGECTIFIRQVKIDFTTDGQTVAGHVIITQGIWRNIQDGHGKMVDCPFSVDHRNPPEGLPLVDESHPVGSLISQPPTEGKT